MSLFLLHQTATRIVALTDSRLAREHDGGAGQFFLKASKLINLGCGAFACHAGTWQPALAMLSDLSALLRSSAGKRMSHASLLSKLEKIGTERDSEFARLFRRADVDVRIALILTGRLRHPLDIKDRYTSSIMIWEKARSFVPHRSRGHVYFAVNPQISQFATATLEQPLLKAMLNSTPLSAAQALLATHAAIARVSSLVSDEANVAVIDNAANPIIVAGQMQELPWGTVLEG